jgi:hypothetical protein
VVAASFVELPERVRTDDVVGLEQSVQFTGGGFAKRFDDLLRCSLLVAHPR